MTRDVLRAFQASLRHHRNASGLSQAALASHLGIHQQSLHRMETGRHELRLSMAHRIAAFFGRDLSGFLEDAAFLGTKRASMR